MARKEALPYDIRVAVFEDDRDFAAQLECLIRQYTHHPTAINTASIEELTRWIEKTDEPVLYFLDIVSDDKTLGFQIAQQICNQNNGSLIVFLTAYPKKIINNAFFKVKAFTVILKNNPALGDEIMETITLAEQVMQAKCLYIMVDKFQTLYIPYDKICYLETIKSTNKLCIHCNDGQYVIRETLKVMQESLAPLGFARCHKSILVNKANIRKMDKTAMSLTFHNGATCPYSYLMKRNLGDIK